MNKETSPNLHESNDKLVAIRILDHPKHWPKHNYKCCVIRVLPREHERVRALADGRIEIMLAKAELQKLIEGFSLCDPDFKVTFLRPMENKPEARREYWRRVNQSRSHPSKLGHRRLRSGS